MLLLKQKPKPLHLFVYSYLLALKKKNKREALCHGEQTEALMYCFSTLWVVC